MTPPRVTFYTIANDLFFPGVVALLNALHVTGNLTPERELVVLDHGFSCDQRQRLERHARVVSPPPGIATNPTLSKPFAHLLDPHGIVVIIDSDMVVTRPLDDVVAAAAAGHICLFSDEMQDERFFPEWRELFSLRSPLRRERNQNAGFVALDVAQWPEFLPRWWSACEAIDEKGTRARGASWDSPVWNGDQDALNALLMSEVPPESLYTRPQVVAPLLHEVVVRDETTLTCTRGGEAVALLHYTGTPKPWQREGWMRVQRDAYVRLLPRLLLRPDVVLRIRPRELPLWLRDGEFGALPLSALSALNASVRAVVRRTPRRVYARLRDFRNRLAHGI